MCVYESNALKPHRKKGTNKRLAKIENIDIKYTNGKGNQIKNIFVLELYGVTYIFIY